MKKYTVHFTTVASTSVTIEADDPDRAIDGAYEKIQAFLCHQCGRDIDLGGEWEPEAVFDEVGQLVWQEVR